MAPIDFRRRSNDGVLIRQIKACARATDALAEVASRIARDGAVEVDEACIRAVCEANEREQFNLKTLIAEMCGFGPEECVDNADEFRGSLVASFIAVIEGRRPVEGLVEADVLTPGLMAAE